LRAKPQDHILKGCAFRPICLCSDQSHNIFHFPNLLWTTPMRKILAILVLATGLSGCGLISLLMDGFKHVKAVEEDLEQVTGIKPEVGFHWTNGTLEVVTVTFPRVYDAKPLSELAEEVRAIVRKEFKQKPEKLVLGFSLGSAASGQSAQIEQAP
jgi:hypothetical protein